MDCHTTSKGDDRLSALPDDLILQILSFVGLKDAIGTSVLSPRWRDLWTSIPSFSFSTHDFSRMKKFSKFVTRALSRHNNQVQLSSFNLRIRREGGHDLTQWIINHVFSLNVKKVNIIVLFTRKFYLLKEALTFLLSLPGSQTLNHLTLRRFHNSCNEIILTSAHEFPSLTTLILNFITLDDGFLSMFPNLKNLTLNCCKINGQFVLRICHPRLSNLTLEKRNLWTRRVIVVTPQLENLTIVRHFARFYISTPKLAFLQFTGDCPWVFSTDDGFHSLKQVLFSFCYIGNPSYPEYAHVIISMLQQFHSVKHLSLSTNIIQLLNSFVKLISLTPNFISNRLLDMDK